MALNPSSSDTLPEPKHPFARWSGLVMISSVAVLAQSATEPWKKILAIASPGFGYVIGQLMQFGIDRSASIYIAVSTRYEIRSLDRTIQTLIREKDTATKNGSRIELVNAIDEAIFDNQQRKLLLMNASRNKA